MSMGKNNLGQTINNKSKGNSQNGALEPAGNFIMSDVFRVNTAPTGNNSATLIDSAGVTFGATENSTFQTADNLSINEQTGEATSITNGTRNTLNDSATAQFSEQKGLTEGRSTSDTTSDLDAATHTASKGVSTRTSQAEDHMVRELALSMAGGDAFEALKMFNSNSQNRAMLSALVNQQKPILENVTAPPQKTVAQKGKEFVGVDRGDIETNYNASITSVQAVNDNSVKNRQNEKSIDMPNKTDFMARTRKERDQANYKLGLTMVANSEYLQTETGIRSVLERAFGGAMTYSSPAEIYTQLNEQANQSETVKQTLTDLGKIASHGMPQEEIIRIYNKTRN